MHIPDEKRRKLDPKAVKGVFVGYPEGRKGYKIYIPESKKFAASRDVTFMEKSFCTESVAGEEPFYTSSIFENCGQPAEMIKFTSDEMMGDNSTNDYSEPDDLIIEEERDDDTIIIEMQDNVHATVDGTLADTMTDH